MANAGAKGWIVETVEVGGGSGGNWSSYANAGYGVIVRLNQGYGYAGTIPPVSGYDDFAYRCGQYVKNSSGVEYWIIGNEPNLPCEWPGNIDGDPNTGEAITVANYVHCYGHCYDAIKGQVSTAKVCPAPRAPGRRSMTEHAGMSTACYGIRELLGPVLEWSRFKQS